MLGQPLLDGQFINFFTSIWWRPLWWYFRQRVPSYKMCSRFVTAYSTWTCPTVEHSTHTQLTQLLGRQYWHQDTALFTVCFIQDNVNCTRHFLHCPLNTVKNTEYFAPYSIISKAPAVLYNGDLATVCFCQSSLLAIHPLFSIYYSLHHVLFTRVSKKHQMWWHNFYHSFSCSFLPLDLIFLFWSFF